MSLIDKVKFLGLAAYHYVRGDFTISRMPKKRKRRVRRGKPAKKRRRRGGFGTKGGGRRSGSYRRTGRQGIIPRSLGLFPYKAKVMLHYHEGPTGMVSLAGGLMNTLHYRMNDIFDPLVNVGGIGDRVSYYEQIKDIYQQYVVKSCRVKIKARAKAGNGDSLNRVWLYNDNTGTTPPSLATVESWMDKRLTTNNPMKWKHIHKQKPLVTLRAKFFPYKTTSDTALIRDHLTSITATPSAAHNFAIGFDEPEALGTPGMNYDVWITYETILYKPQVVAEVAAAE